MYDAREMEKIRALNPVEDLETVMAMLAAIVAEHAPGYRGGISLEFCDLPFPEDQGARFRGNVFVDPPAGGEPYDGFTTSSEIALEMDRALREGWLDYEGDLVLVLHDLPKAEPFVVLREGGHRIAFEFGV